jgi:hypothetical protein
MRKTGVFLCVAAAATISALWARGEDLRLLPEAVRLSGPHARQRLLVEAWDGRAFVGDHSTEAKVSSDNPGVVRVEQDGTLVPTGNGLAMISATCRGKTVTTCVSVEDFDLESTRSFRNHVEPVLTKQGCNSGACHGAAAGKNGLRLSLRGYAPELDYEVLTRQALGRRIVPAAPAESLMLLKPSGALAHGGGVRFTPGSHDYRVLAEWIADGMPPPGSNDPRVVALRVLPGSVRLAPGQTQQVLVQSVSSDGRVDDVTHWAKFSTTDETAARVDDSGRIHVVGRGEAAISVWYSSAVARLTVTSPQAAIDPSVFSAAARNNPIDERNLAKLELLGIPPSPDAGDAAFLRRAYLDATGTLPPTEQANAFLADRSPSKRQALVDRLLQSPEYVDYWTYKWSDLFLVSSTKLGPQGVWSFHRFLRRAVEQNQPWDQLARSLLTARGSNLQNGSAGFFVLHRDPIDLAESTSMAFLGLSLTCARCHNHPLEKWTQDQYYGFASLFSRVQLKDGTAAGEVIVTTAADGEILHPRRGAAMPPRPLDASEMSPDSRQDRREVLARWLTAPENPYFARAIVNRVWANFFGRGLIHPEDDLRATNPPSDEPLLDWLVADFVAHRFDLKHLIRTIMTSAVYARSSVPVAGNEADAKFLSHYPVKRLPAEVLLDAVSSVAGVPTPFSGYPSGWRSLQLPDSKIESRFLEAFGRPVRESTCSCERSSEPSMAQALHLANGTTINEKLSSDTGAVARQAGSARSDAEILEHLYLAALSRRPNAEEVRRMLTLLATPSGLDAKQRAQARRQAIEDLYWAVLTSREFLFNH